MTKAGIDIGESVEVLDTSVDFGEEAEATPNSEAAQ